MVIDGEDAGSVETKRDADPAERLPHPYWNRHALVKRSGFRAHNQHRVVDRLRARLALDRVRRRRIHSRKVVNCGTEVVQLHIADVLQVVFAGSRLHRQPRTDGEYLSAPSAAVERLVPERFACLGPPGNHGLRKDENSCRTFGCFLLDELRRDEIPEGLRNVAEMGIRRDPSARRVSIARTEEATADSESHAETNNETQNNTTSAECHRLRGKKNTWHQPDRRDADPGRSRKQVTSRCQRRSESDNPERRYHGREERQWRSPQALKAIRRRRKRPGNREHDCRQNPNRNRDQDRRGLPDVTVQARDDWPKTGAVVA